MAHGAAKICRLTDWFSTKFNRLIASERGLGYIDLNSLTLVQDFTPHGVPPQISGRVHRRNVFMSDLPLMPKATAVWLVDNSSLTFDQIADFCGLHPLEVKAIADGENLQGIKGLDPVSTGQLTTEELDKAQEDPKHRLKLHAPRVRVPSTRRKSPRYTPVSKRQDRPNAIRWLTRSHPELKDSQIIRLVGTTKNTIEAIRGGTHWNSANLTPLDPVTLGLCTQIALDFEVAKANKDRPQPAPEEVEAENADKLKPVSDSQVFADTPKVVQEAEEEVDAASVFSKFSGKGDAEIEDTSEE